MLQSENLKRQELSTCQMAVEVMFEDKLSLMR